MQPPVCTHAEKTHRPEADLYVSATATERLFQMAPAGAFPIRPVNNHNTTDDLLVYLISDTNLYSSHFTAKPEKILHTP